MSVLTANCPSCGGQIEFKSGSTIVVVCPFCRSAVARTDRSLQDLGKVAELAETDSPLRVGLKGLFKGERFELTGRAQMGHEMGGMWDEWYATFSNGWVGWLAEAQGKFYLTFFQPTPQGRALPTFEELQIGQPVPGLSAFIVAERGAATALAADGEIPYQLTPGEQFRFADLSAQGGAFGTIDYSTTPPYLFTGHEVTLADIGLAEARAPERKERKVSAVGMGCPNCGGPINLTAPDKSERVTCPNCDSLLDVKQGNLTWLHALAPQPEAYPFVLEIGAEGTFKDGVKMKVIGGVTRSVVVDSVKYFWNEYLLYEPRIGFRWLVQSDNHWNYVEPVGIADVQDNGTTAAYNGQTYRIFQDAMAVVEYVKGEFYWRVEFGETVRARDFINPPFMLSGEMSQNELNWSLGAYMTKAEVEKAFGVSGLPGTWNVAPNQPFPHKSFLRYSWLLVGILVIAGILMIPLGSISSTVASEDVTLPPMANAETDQVAFSKPFELKGNRNVRVTASAPVDNSYAELDFDLINEQNSEVESFPVDISFYKGTEDGEAWTEGGQSSEADISAVPAGKYSLRISGNWQSWQQPLPVKIKIEQNVLRGVNFWLCFILLLIVPVLTLIWKFSFESRRWSESMFTVSGGGNTGGDE
jgi:Zn finger protein HypA/HybF involved in hydrogenase expression